MCSSKNGRHIGVVVVTNRGVYEVCHVCGHLREHSLTKFGRARQWRAPWGADEEVLQREAQQKHFNVGGIHA